MADSRQTCIIIGGANIGDYNRIKSYIKPDDFVIFCDSGLKHLEKTGAKPSLIVGDFDSHANPKMNVETIALPREKDDTDTMFGVKEGIKRGFKNFILLGVTGGRLDHTLANVYILLYLEKAGVKGLIADDYSEISIISNEPAYIEDSYPYFSIVNIDNSAKGVTIENAKFPLENVEISPEYQYAVSNEVIKGKRAKVSLKAGRLLLIKDVI